MMIIVMMMVVVVICANSTHTYISDEREKPKGKTFFSFSICLLEKKKPNFFFLFLANPACVCCCFFLWKKNVMSEKIEFKFFFFLVSKLFKNFGRKQTKKVRIIYEMGKKMFGFFCCVFFNSCCFNFCF